MSVAHGRVPWNRGTIFDSIAAQYDRGQPGYPQALADQVMNFSQVTPGARVLEIGCGTGQATPSFASRGLHILCLEPGPNLATLAQKNLAPFPNVRVRCVTFENWPLEPHAFDLIISAKAFHWVARRVRFVKTAHALRPGGSLALFQNNIIPGEAPVDFSLRRAAGDLAHALLPHGWGPSERQFRNSSYFEPLSTHTLHWTRDYDAAAYGDLLQSTLRLRRVSDTQRNDFSNAAHAIILEHGDRITVRYATRLLIARRAKKLDWCSRLLRRSRRFL